MERKEKYIKFCNECDNVNLFSKPWWLDTVVGKDSWNVIVSEKGNSIQGALPYYYVKKNKSISINQPLLTPRNGLIINYPKNQKKTTKLSFERKVSKEIIEKLEDLELESYSQNFNYNFENWLPFYWKEFKQTTRYSYIIHKDNTLDEIYTNIDSTTKNLIRKAEKLVKVEYDIDVEKFYKINSMTYERKNLKIPYSFELVKAIDKACEDRECRKIIAGIDNEGNIHSAIYLVWDEKYMYYLMGGINPDFKGSNATSLLLYKAIELAKEKNLHFDFEGSMDEGIEKFFSSFGGEQTPYFRIYKQYKINARNEIARIVSNSKSLKTLANKIRRR